MLNKFAVSCVKKIKNMSTKTNKPSLREKILKKNIEPQPKNNGITSNFPFLDIEDSIGGQIKSEHFSPIQTRQQRKISNKPINMREVTNFKHIKLEENTETKVPIKVAIKQESKVKQEKEVKPNINAEVPQVVIWEPTNWESVLDNIRKMRACTLAPVDTMGCHKCSNESVDNKTRRFHVLVSLMLSSQTKDETTFAAVERLRTNLLTPETLALMPTSDLENLIKPVSFYKTKAKHLQLASRILIDQYNSDIPHSIAELIKLPGVGPKMAHLCMSEAWNEITGIGVDVHVHRISNRLNWVPKETKKPEETRVQLESWLPRSLWRDANHLLVGFGQTICTPLRPKCSLCLNCDICPSAGKVAIKKETKAKSKKLLL